jgi:hypothetical protein
MQSEEIKAITATLRSPGWGLIRARVRDKQREMHAAAHVERDPFSYGKLGGAAFGADAIMEVIESLAEAPPDPGEVEEDFDTAPEGVDRQTKGAS